MPANQFRNEAYKIYFDAMLSVCGMINKPYMGEKFNCPVYTEEALRLAVRINLCLQDTLTLTLTEAESVLMVIVECLNANGAKIKRGEICLPK